ncbi:MAG TPA: hypothetical protein GXZ43_02105 [Clostridiaceae bacterium]|mgnify:CR=1 FL=1|nr:hypothetical protein [Clostridiaceae bacterium]
MLGFSLLLAVCKNNSEERVTESQSEKSITDNSTAEHLSTDNNSAEESPSETITSGPTPQVREYGYWIDYEIG